jgi:1-acyl-sn-glycerol-3-phosphate acyltransferase
VKIRTLFVGLIAIICILVLIPVLILCFILRWRAPILAAGKGFIVLAGKIVGLRVEVTGRENIPGRGPCLYMANHQSFLDGPLLFWAVPGAARVILKREIFRLPIVGLGMLFVGFISVDRKGLKSGRRSLDQAAALMAKRKYSYIVFPEGTRTRDGRLQPFRRGGFFLALNTGVSVVPVTIRGTFPLMPRGSFFIRKGEVRITFHPPVAAQGLGSDDLPSLSEAVRKAIASGFEE